MEFHRPAGNRCQATVQPGGAVEKLSFKGGMMDWKTFSDELTQMIRPQTFPLGVKLFKRATELPAKATRPARYGIRISLCQWTTMARRWGRILLPEGDADAFP